MTRTAIALFFCVSPVLASAQSTGTFTGRVVSRGGDPISEAKVTLPEFGDAKPLAQGTTDKNGRFQLLVTDRKERSIHRRSPALVVQAEGYATSYVHSRHLTLFPGQDKHLGEIVLGHGTQYTGRIVDQNGNALPTATVRCGSYCFVGASSASVIGEEQTVEVDSNGRFQTPQLPLGVPHLIVQADGYREGKYEPESFADAGPKGTLPDLKLIPEVPIHGRVSSEDGEPLKSAKVLANGRQVITDADGKFVLHGFGEEAYFQLRVIKSGYKSIGWGVTVTPSGFEYFEGDKLRDLKYHDEESAKKAMKEITSELESLDIVMKNEGMIRGRAIDADTREPVQISRIVLCTFTRDKNGEAVLNGCQDRDFSQPRPGEFVVGFSDLVEYHLAVSADGYEDGEAFTPPIAHLGGIDGIVVELKRIYSRSDEAVSIQHPVRQVIAGAVSDSHLENARVALWLPPKEFNATNARIIRGRTTSGDGFVFSSTLVKDGSFSLDVPYQGDNWYVLAEAPTRIVSLVGPISVNKNETKTIELAQKSAGEVRGTVANYARVATPLHAILFSDVGVQYETPVQLDGTFEFQSVYPGTYGLKVGSDSILDSDIPGKSKSNDLNEDLVEQGIRPSRPWDRAHRVTVRSGQSVADLRVRFEP